ncbi:HTH domain-containing protein [Ammonicoccus fulvus]|uniref:HTH domain-containing protein n=1 Tax=Ammonicoccus fulvus TaxID=3138240 RepID=A0ABZ3FSL6_9ACTN
MRASRLVELLVRLQLHGGASATELAEALEVSVRTIYRDVEALSAAGVPVWTETGRNGGIRIDPAYRIAGLPRLDPDEARGVLFAAVPAIGSSSSRRTGSSRPTAYRRWPTFPAPSGTRARRC